MELKFCCVSNGCSKEVEYVCSCSFLISYCKDHLPKDQIHCSNIIVSKSVFESKYMKKISQASHTKKYLIESGKDLTHQIIGLVNFYTKQIDSNSLGILDIKNFLNTQPSEELIKKLNKAAKTYLRVYGNDITEAEEPKAFIDGKCEKCILLKNEKNAIIRKNDLNETRLNNEILRLKSNIDLMTKEIKTKESIIDQMTKEIKIKESIVEEQKYKRNEENEEIKNKLKIFSVALDMNEVYSNYIKDLAKGLKDGNFIDEKEVRLLNINEEINQIYRDLVRGNGKFENEFKYKITEYFEGKFNELEKYLSELRNEKKQFKKEEAQNQEIEDSSPNENNENKGEITLNNFATLKKDSSVPETQSNEEKQNGIKHSSIKFTLRKDPKIVTNIVRINGKSKKLKIFTPLKESKSQNKIEPKKSYSQTDSPAKISNLNTPKSASSTKFPGKNDHHTKFEFTNIEDSKIFENSPEGKKNFLISLMKGKFDLEKLGSKIIDIKKSKNDEYYTICKGY